jgi:hypothetical protein
VCFVILDCEFILRELYLWVSGTAVFENKCLQQELSLLACHLGSLSGITMLILSLGFLVHVDRMNLRKNKNPTWE